MGEWVKYVCLVAHVGYCFGFAYYVVPIVRLHLGFISRNELANEWKHALYYTIDDQHGNTKSVGELDVEEYNQRYDSFCYDESRNPFDEGCFQNWMTFLFRSGVPNNGEF